MTKKDYIQAAKLIRKSYFQTEVFNVFCEFFQSDNPKFDEERFAEAVFDGKVRARRGTKPRDL